MIQAFKWEVKEVAPLVRGLTGAAYHGDARHEPTARVGDDEAGDGTVDHADQPGSTPTTSETTTAAAAATGGDELPEPGTTRNLLAKFQCLQTTTQ